MKLVIRLPGFVSEDLFLAALSDADRATVRASRYFAFVPGKPKSKALPKRLSLCWLALSDAAAATAFVRSCASQMQFRDAADSTVASPPLGAQFDSALYQHVHTLAAPLRATQTFSFASDPDFAAFRSVYDAGGVPLLNAIVTTPEQAAAALAPPPPASAPAAPPRATIVDMLLHNASQGKRPKKAPKAARPRDPNKPPKGKRARAKWLRAQAGNASDAQTPEAKKKKKKHRHMPKKRAQSTQ